MFGPLWVPWGHLGHLCVVETEVKRMAKKSATTDAATQADKTTGAAPERIEDQVTQVRRRKLSRRRFVLGLTAAGVTAAAAATILEVANHQAAAHASQQKTQQHIKQHDQHVTSQVHGDIGGHMADYAEHAVVDDPLFAGAFVGKAAITTRFAAEVASVPNRTLQITNRALRGEQLIVEWVAAGTHATDFLGRGVAGRSYTISGVTVVTREQGRIVRESHYYDVAELLRQIEA